ncbi:hypothetical protein FISHEDRAFT_8253, partial [Fistulina hepatica ATCC 64428]
ATNYLEAQREETSSPRSANESLLLKSIRHALRGTGAGTSEKIHSICVVPRSDSNTHDVEYVSWNSHTVILSSGLIIQKKWCLKHEGEPIQCVCTGIFEINSAPSLPSNSFVQKSPVQDDVNSNRPTFGPFSTIVQQSRHAPKTESLIHVPAIFIFLRTMVRIFLRNGMEYTCALPFIVRQAWPLSPHGVMMQRVLEPTELEEAAETGDDPLPTLFTLVGPFAEPVPVGLTDGIIGGFYPGILSTGPRPPEMRLSDLSEIAARPLKGLPTTAMVVWSSFREASESDHNLFVTIDQESRELAVWRYMYVKPADIPPLSRRRRASRKSRQSRGLSPIRPPVTFNDMRAAPAGPVVPPLESLPQNHVSLGDIALTSLEQGKMMASHWSRKIHIHPISEADAASWQDVSVAVFDHRRNAKNDQCLLAVCFKQSQTLLIFAITPGDDLLLHAHLVKTLSAISVTSIRATRDKIYDLIYVRPDNTLALMMHGTEEVNIRLVKQSSDDAMVLDSSPSRHLTSVVRGPVSCVSLLYDDGTRESACIDLVSHDALVKQALLVFSQALPTDLTFQLHFHFLESWSARHFSTRDGIEFQCFEEALCQTVRLAPSHVLPDPASPFQSLMVSRSHQRFGDDPVLRLCEFPAVKSDKLDAMDGQPHDLLPLVLWSLHCLAEDLRLMADQYELLKTLVPLICRIANLIRPEWTDYWRRMCPDSVPAWPSVSVSGMTFTESRIPVWPPDIAAMLYSRISNPEWTLPAHDILGMSVRFGVSPSLIYGRVEPLPNIRRLYSIYKRLADASIPTGKRAENAVGYMAELGVDESFIDRLALGVAAPIREAMRTCQLSPPSYWRVSAYRAIGRNDLSASCGEEMQFMGGGYRPIKEFINPTDSRKTMGRLVLEAKSASSGEVDVVSGVELGAEMEDFVRIRFGQDRRLDDVARMLNTSTVATIKIMERPDINEHEQAKEHQSHATRMAERTLAIPYGRAMYTFGTILTVNREAYAIPKLEYSVRILPHNITVTPENGVSYEAASWGEFHNGVAAGLRISPTATGIEGSWIAFNKPSELTAQHAGYLYGLGLTGHLREMLTWHTFSYLTPKHDLTSIGVLLGLSAANVGTADPHVTRLLAVHTPALLPIPNVDLNVSLLTQAAGLSGTGLLYMGTKNRRMAEVCLGQIGRRDLIPSDINNEYREAYTYSAAIAFGMIMLGKGSNVPADMDLVSRLTVFIHGDSASDPRRRTSFDLSLTSPAATIALGLMYLRTNRRDITDIMAIPETVLDMNHVQPFLLLIRTIGRALVMWDEIRPTPEWVASQIPHSVRMAMDARNKQQKEIDDALELAYYNIVAGCCFALGLKYAGTARQEAYLIIIRYYDSFTRLVYANVPAFDHRIKRSAVRDGLNLISVALCMVMAGTGEISCLRRLRYSYGVHQQAIYHPGFKYSTHLSTHTSLGLLFLGGGRYTLGTSDSAVACMVAAFFPRYQSVSADNRSYMQALRHLWVIAVEPRCLIARDVDTTEVVYLPVKITMKEGDHTGTTQLISPTLFPDMSKLLSIRVDTPRYWPFYLDTEHLPRHRESLLKSQTLYVKRRTAFLSYVEDPKGSRSLFVRSGSSAGDAAMLDVPQMTDTRVHPAGDVSEFITSFSNDVVFLAFADHFCRPTVEHGFEQLFHSYCHASLLDSILQDKPQTLQSHLTLFKYRHMPCPWRYFQLGVQELRFMADFYGKIFDRRFSGRSENMMRHPLVREETVMAALHDLDDRLTSAKQSARFRYALYQYVNGAPVKTDNERQCAHELAWYLLRNCVPVSSLLVVLKGLARDATAQCSSRPAPDGTDDLTLAEEGILQVLHVTGSKVTTVFGSGWSVRSLREIVGCW